jgi:hypothetical protein
MIVIDNQLSLMKKFKTFFAVGFAIAGLFASATASINSFNDITYWVGSGSNESALVIDFGSSGGAYAWGYRWDEPISPAVVSGADMILAIAADDPNLSIAHLGTANDGFFLQSITYKSDTGANNPTPPYTPFWNYALAGGSSGVGEYDPAYVDGDPLPQTWSYSDGGTNLPSTWTAAKAGAADFSETYSDASSTPVPGRSLADGSWDAWVLGEFSAVPSGPITAAPEPSSFPFLAAFFVLGIALLRRKAR